MPHTDFRMYTQVKEDIDIREDFSVETDGGYQLVVYNDAKQPESVRYNDLPVALLPAFQQLIRRVQTSESTIRQMYLLNNY